MRGKIKPSKPVALCQMMGGAMFFGIGLLFVIPALSKAGGPVWFGLLWTAGALGITVFGAINFFSKTGIPTEEFEYSGNSGVGTVRKTTASRLEDLAELKKKNLITDEEYEMKRSELLKQI